MTKPLVSVCVPTYNYGRFIGRCIESIQAQTYTNWELLIADDCSTDETARIVQEAARADPRIRYFNDGVRRGMNGNIKYVTELGKGKYLKPLCSDDWLGPRYLERLVALMEAHPTAGVATSATVTTDEHENPLITEFIFENEHPLIPGGEMMRRMVRGEGFGGHSAFLLRTEAYERVGGYDDTLVYAADYDLGARLCLDGDYIHVDEPLFFGRIHGATSSSVNPAKLLDVQDAFAIPRKIFQPRRPFSKNWRRYQNLTARLTARYLLTAAVAWAGGRRPYATALWSLVRQKGNLAVGVPYLAYEIPSRALRRARGAKPYPTRPAPPPEAWRGS